MKFVTKIHSIVFSYTSYIISYISYMAYTVQYSECHKAGWGGGGGGVGSIFGRKEAILENYIHTLYFQIEHFLQACAL
jgi:hypothetical protein